MATWQDRLNQAHRFLDVAEAAHDPSHTSEAAANAIQAVIAANDAVCLYLAGRRPTGKSHTEAGQMLQEVCRSTKWEAEAAQRSEQLVELLRQKNAAEYGGRPLTAAAADRIMKQAARFVEWADDVVLP